MGEVLAGGSGLAVQLVWLILGSGDQSQDGAIGWMEERLEAKMGPQGRKPWLFCSGTSLTPSPQPGTLSRLRSATPEGILQIPTMLSPDSPDTVA